MFIEYRISHFIVQAFFFFFFTKDALGFCSYNSWNNAFQDYCLFTNNDIQTTFSSMPERKYEVLKLLQIHHTLLGEASFNISSMVYYFCSLIFSNLIKMESSLFYPELFRCISKGLVYLRQVFPAYWTGTVELCVPSTVGVSALCFGEGCVLFYLAFSCVSVQTSKRWIKNVLN